MRLGSVDISCGTDWSVIVRGEVIEELRDLAVHGIVGRGNALPVSYIYRYICIHRGLMSDTENEITYTLQEAIDLVGDYPTQCQDCETGLPCHAKRIGSRERLRQRHMVGIDYARPQTFHWNAETVDLWLQKFNLCRLQRDQAAFDALVLAGVWGNTTPADMHAEIPLPARKDDAVAMLTTVLAAQEVAEHPMDLDVALDDYLAMLAPKPTESTEDLLSRLEDEAQDGGGAAS